MTKKLDTTEESARALEAQAKVIRERGKNYGPPDENLGRTAKMWSAYLGIHLHPHDVAALHALSKLSRLASDPKHMDSWVDGGGYLTIGGILAKDKTP